MSDKKVRKYLLIVAFVLLVVTKIIGNGIAGGLAVLFAMAVVSAVLTDRLGSKRKNAKR